MKCGVVKVGGVMVCGEREVRVREKRERVRGEMRMRLPVNASLLCLYFVSFSPSLYRSPNLLFHCIPPSSSV